jgi:hypothetical protein
MQTAQNAPGSRGAPATHRTAWPAPDLAAWADLARPGSELRRLPDWQSRFAAYLEQCRERPFAWGTSDCVRFCEGAVHAVTGWRLPIGPSWCDLDTARGVLRLLGGLIPAVDARLPRVRIEYAHRGDVLLVRDVRRCTHLAVRDGAGWVAPGAAGLVRGTLDHVRLAWGVGHHG